MYVLEINNVKKTIGRKILLDDINIKVRDNVIFGLVGCNGAGKTTLLKLILGLYKTNKGNIYINGCSINKETLMALKNVGAVMDTPALYRYLSGKRNIDFFNLLGKNVNEKEKEKIINLLNLGNYVNKPVSTYSLGMKQRLSLAIALVSNPKLLILDEPLNGLDPNGIRDLRNILLFLKRKYRMTIVISSHILAEMENLCDEVAFIKNKKIIDIVNIKTQKESLEKLYFERNKNNV